MIFCPDKSCFEDFKYHMLEDLGDFWSLEDFKLCRVGGGVCIDGRFPHSVGHWGVLVLLYHTYASEVNVCLDSLLLYMHYGGAFSRMQGEQYVV